MAARRPQGAPTDETNSVFTLLHSWFLPSNPANTTRLRKCRAADALPAPWLRPPGSVWKPVAVAHPHAAARAHERDEATEGDELGTKAALVGPGAAGQAASAAPDSNLPAAAMAPQQCHADAEGPPSVSAEPPTLLPQPLLGSIPLSSCTAGLPPVGVFRRASACASPRDGCTVDGKQWPLVPMAETPSPACSRRSTASTFAFVDASTNTQLSALGRAHAGDTTDVGAAAGRHPNWDAVAAGMREGTSRASGSCGDAASVAGSAASAESSNPMAAAHAARVAFRAQRAPAQPHAAGARCDAAQRGAVPFVAGTLRAVPGDDLASTGDAAALQRGASSGWSVSSGQGACPPEAQQQLLLQGQQGGAQLGPQLPLAAAERGLGQAAAGGPELRQDLQNALTRLQLQYGQLHAKHAQLWRQFERLTATQAAHEARCGALEREVAVRDGALARQERELQALRERLGMLATGSSSAVQQPPWAGEFAGGPAYGSHGGIAPGDTPWYSQPHQQHPQHPQHQQRHQHQQHPQYQHQPQHQPQPQRHFHPQNYEQRHDQQGWQQLPLGAGPPAGSVQSAGPNPPEFSASPLCTARTTASSSSSHACVSVGNSARTSSGSAADAPWRNRPAQAGERSSSGGAPAAAIRFHENPIPLLCSPELSQPGQMGAGSLRESRESCSAASEWDVSPPRNDAAHSAAPGARVGLPDCDVTGEAAVEGLLAVRVPPQYGMPLGADALTLHVNQVADEYGLRGYLQSSR